MRKQNWKLVLAATLALGTSVRAQETSPLRTQEASSSAAADGVSTVRRSQLGKGTGSPYGELDSWIYTVLDRLAALGYIHSQFIVIRPWIRIVCVSMLHEAGKE